MANSFALSFFVQQILFYNTSDIIFARVRDSYLNSTLQLRLNRAARFAYRVINLIRRYKDATLPIPSARIDA